MGDGQLGLFNASFKLGLFNARFNGPQPKNKKRECCKNVGPDKLKFLLFCEHYFFF